VNVELLDDATVKSHTSTKQAKARVERAAMQSAVDSLRMACSEATIRTSNARAAATRASGRFINSYADDLDDNIKRYHRAEITSRAAAAEERRLQLQLDALVERFDY